MAWALPALLGGVGIALIIISLQGSGDAPTTSLPPIVPPSSSAVAQGSPSVVETASALPTETTAPTEAPSPTPTPLPEDVVAEQLEIPSVGINVIVRQSEDEATNQFPPRDAAYVLQGGSQPGRNTNSYISAHANEWLFKPLWNVQLGAEILVRMSNDQVLRYTVTEIRPNVPCPDPNTDPALDPPDPPPVLELYDTCDEGVFWLQPTPYERLTLQTSQGFNRNWGEFVVVAEPAQ
jgi:hypothetical protein